MKGGNPAHRLRIEHGAGLIEVMIAMVIGLVLLFALVYFFLGGRLVNRTSDDVSRMQESGRNAVELMGRAIRQAGYRTDDDVGLDIAFSVSGIAITGTNGAPGLPDTITVQYAAQAGGEADCVGTNVAAGLVTARFAVKNKLTVPSADPPVLTCNDIVVVDNIEDVQITYGIDGDRDGNIEFYKTAPTATEFGQVAAVRVSLLVRGPSLNVATNHTQTYLYNGVKVTSTDGYLRQVYDATFTVRNQAW